MTSTSTTPLPPILENMASITGPLVVGMMLNWLLYGTLVMQISVYYQCFPDDRTKTKALVYGVFTLDTAQSVLATADAFHWFAKGYGNLLILFDPGLTPLGANILDGIIAFIVQSFFCWRLWLLQKSLWLPSTVFVLSVTSLTGALASAIRVFQIRNLKAIDTLRWEISLWLAGSALTDTVIAVSMTYLLLRSRRRYYAHTNNILVRIVRLTVVTNTATAAVAITQLISLFAVPHNPSIAMAPAYALGKLYSNTILAILNSRVYSRGMLSRHSEATATGFSISLHDSNPSQTATESTTERRHTVLFPMSRKSHSKRPRSRSEPPPMVSRFKESEDHTLISSQISPSNPC